VYLKAAFTAPDGRITVAYPALEQDKEAEWLMAYLDSN